MLPPRPSQAAHFERNGVIIMWETIHWFGRDELPLMLRAYQPEKRLFQTPDNSMSGASGNLGARRSTSLGSTLVVEYLKTVCPLLSSLARGALGRCALLAPRF